MRTVRIMTWNLWWRFADEVRLLAGSKTAPAADGLVLTDAWRYAHDAAPGWTSRRDNPYIAYDVNARIDYLHVGPFGPQGQGAPTCVELAGSDDVDGVRPSDHLAVFGDFRTGD